MYGLLVDLLVCQLEEFLHHLTLTYQYLILKEKKMVDKGKTRMEQVMELVLDWKALLYLLKMHHYLNLLCVDNK